MKLKKHFAGAARLLYLGSIALLLLSGFLMEWLVKGLGFGRAAATVLLPALPAVLVYGLEYRCHLLDRSPNSLKDKPYLPIALPIMLICYSVIAKEHCQNLNLYWSAGYLLCCYITYVTLSGVPGVRCGMFLAQTALFGYLSVYQDFYAGGSIAIGVLSAFLLLHMAAAEQEDPLSVPVAVLALVCMVLRVIVPVFEKLLYCAVSQETFLVLDAFRNLLPRVSAFGQTALTFAEYEGLLFGHQLGYLLARLGWMAAIPVGLAAVGMVIGGFALAANDRRISILTFGCHMLLVLRLVSALLYLPGLVMGLCSDIPFLGGDAAQRTVDCLLCAMVLLPMAPAALDELDPQDPDFQVRERKALEALHHNRTGLTRLCRYVYDNPHALQAWCFLFDKFLDLMDANTLGMMLRNADAVLPSERFRENFSSEETPDLSEEEAALFDCRCEVEEESNFRTSGVFLSRYLGFRDTLRLPPFWLAIGESALADNAFLRAVSVPNTVLRICENAFRSCSALTHVVLRRGLIALDDFAFCGTGLTQIRLPASLECLGKGCFQDTALHCVQIPGSVREIPEDCFADNPQLETVVLEEGVHLIGAGAFRNCSALRSIRIPASMRCIHVSAFEGCTAPIRVETKDGCQEWDPKFPLPVPFPRKEKEEVL